MANPLVLAHLVVARRPRRAVPLRRQLADAWWDSRSRVRNAAAVRDTFTDVMVILSALMVVVLAVGIGLIALNVHLV